jgi:hypothetical protein
LARVPALLKNFLGYEFIRNDLEGIKRVSEAIWYLAEESEMNKEAFKEANTPIVLRGIATYFLRGSHTKSGAMFNVKGAYTEITGKTFSYIKRLHPDEDET